MSQNGHLGRVSSHPLRETKDERISWEMELGWKNLGRVSSRPGLEREWNSLDMGREQVSLSTLYNMCAPRGALAYP